MLSLGRENKFSLRSLNRNLFAGLDTEALGGLAGLAALEVVGGAVGGLVLHWCG